MNEPKIKDANDLLKKWMAEELSPEDQKNKIRAIMDRSKPLVVAMAGWAGDLSGPEQDRIFPGVFQHIATMEPLLLDKYRAQMAAALNLGIRDFRNAVKTAAAVPKKKDNIPEVMVEMLGGFLRIHDELREEGEEPKGYLLEYLYDPELDEAMFAIRDPEGRIATEPHLDHEGVRYLPKTPNSLMRSGGVLFPSEIGPLKSTRELVAIIEAFINQYYLLDDPFFARLAAYYVLLTWLHDCFNAIPYLRAMGDYGSGKSQLMLRIGHVCYRMMATGGAGTAASLFRALHEYRGTAFMDEMDLTDGGDMANDLIKILNLGAMKGNPVWRLSEVVGFDGVRNYEVQAYDVFGPKLIAMRKDFKDQAVASRCLTIRLMGKEPIELKARGIPLHLDEAFYKKSIHIRNLLIAWRMNKWEREIEVGEALMDLEVPARLNQVTMPLKAIAQDDPELMRDITGFVRALNADLLLERSMGVDARILEALIAIREEREFEDYLMEGAFNGEGQVSYTLTKYVAKVANQIMDEMNIAGNPESDEEDRPKRKVRGTTSQTVGKVARNTLQLKSHRTGKGYAIIFDDIRMAVLKHKYGYETMDMGAIQNE